MLSKAGGMMNRKITGIRACVFDAYGTLFDVNSAAQRSQEMVGDKWQELADLWRTKQLHYTWLRSLAGDHIDFWQLTGEALDWDAYSAKAFGFRVIWCNRYRQAPERIPETPDAEILSLSGLPEIVGVP
jgi:2-haloacid dehalogenase